MSNWSTFSGSTAHEGFQSPSTNPFTDNINGRVLSGAQTVVPIFDNFEIDGDPELESYGPEGLRFSAAGVVSKTDRHR